MSWCGERNDKMMNDEGRSDKSPTKKRKVPQIKKGCDEDHIEEFLRHGESPINDGMVTVPSVHSLMLSPM